MTGDDAAGETAAVVALALYLVGVVVTFGLRSWAHRRRTGSTGFVGVSGPVGSTAWWGAVSFGLALVLTGAGLTASAAGFLEGLLGAPAPRAVAWTGVAITAAGFLAVIASQSGMGTSWRIGVRAGEKTRLVTDGLFAHVRNPIFSAMVVAVAGLTLASPSVLTLAGLVALVVGVEIQVRLTEEPHLVATHGADYSAYASRVGRFVPGVGMLRTPAAPTSGT